MDQWVDQERSGWAAVADDTPMMRVPKMAEIVADHLRGQIVSGALVTGENLPSESVLTGAFGIARPTLREAMRILESEGLISIARGTRTGARVLQPGLSPLVRHAAMLLCSRQVPISDLFAARLAFEPEAVAIICAQADQVPLQGLHRALAAAQAAFASGDMPATILQLSTFHMRLVEAAGNRTMALFAAALHGLVTAQLQCATAFILPDPQQGRTVLADSQAACATLLDLLARRDAAAAGHWRRFLETANSMLMSSGIDRIVALP